jgi:adenylate kinase
MQIIALTGIQGSGKGTQAELMCKEYNLKHISPGDCLRKAIADGTPDGKSYEAAYKRGELAPPALVHSIMQVEMDDVDSFDGLLLDGFPRDMTQLRWLLDNYHLDAVIELVLDEDIVIERLLARGREDDNIDGIKQRIDIWKNETQSLWENTPVSQLMYINSSGSVESVFKRLKITMDILL